MRGTSTPQPRTLSSKTAVGTSSAGKASAARSTPIPSSLQKHQQSLLRRYQQHSAQRRSYSNPLGLPPPPQGILVSPSPSGHRDRDPAAAAARGGANDDAESYAYVMQGLGTSTPTPKKHATGTVSFSAVKSVYSSSGVEVAALPCGPNMPSPIPTAAPHGVSQPSTPLSPLPSASPGLEAEARAEEGGKSVERAMWMSPVRSPGAGAGGSSGMGDRDRDRDRESPSELYRTQMFSPPEASTAASAAVPPAVPRAALGGACASAGSGSVPVWQQQQQQQQLHFSHTILDGEEVLGGGEGVDSSSFAASVFVPRGGEGGAGAAAAEDWQTRQPMSPSSGPHASPGPDRSPLPCSAFSSGGGSGGGGAGKAAISKHNAANWSAAARRNSPECKERQNAAAAAAGNSGKDMHLYRHLQTQKSPRSQSSGGNRDTSHRDKQDKHLHVKYKALSIRQQCMMGALFGKISAALRTWRRMQQSTAFNRWIRACVSERYRLMHQHSVTNYEMQVRALQARLGDMQQEVHVVGGEITAAKLQTLRLRLPLMLKFSLGRGFWKWVEFNTDCNRAVEDKCVQALLAEAVELARQSHAEAEVMARVGAENGTKEMGVGLGVRTRARQQAAKLVGHRLSYQAGFKSLVHWVKQLAFRCAQLARQKAFYHIKLLTMHKRYLKIYTGAVQPLRDYIDYQEGLLRRVEDDISRELYNKSTPFRPTTLWTGPGTGTGVGAGAGTGISDPHRETLRVAQLRVHSDQYKRASLTTPSMFDSIGQCVSPPQDTGRLMSPDTEYHYRRREREKEKEKEKGSSGGKHSHRHKERKHKIGGQEEDKEQEQGEEHYQQGHGQDQWGQTAPSHLPISPAFSAVPTSSNSPSHALTHMPTGALGTLGGAGGFGGPSSMQGQLQLSMHSPVKINDFSVHLNLDLPEVLSAHAHNTETVRKFSPSSTARSHTPAAGEAVYRELEDGPLKPHETYRRYDTARSSSYNAGYGHGLGSGRGHSHGYGRIDS